MKFLFVFVLFMQASFANVLVKNGSDYLIQKTDFKLVDLIEDYANELNYTLLLDNKVKGQMKILGNLNIANKDLDLFASAVAFQLGFTILKSDNIKQLELISLRDVRYKGSEVFNDIKEVPNTYNPYKFTMKLKYIEANELSRNLRPFISRYGRVVDEKNANSIILADSGRNIHRLYDLIKKLDQKEFTSRRELVRKINKGAQKEIKKSKSILSYIKDQHVLFLIAFALIGGIIGFGIRGFVMKKIEGGW